MVHSVEFGTILFSAILSVYGRPNDYDADVRSAADVSNRLGDSLLKILGEESGNVFYSPSSVSTALSAVYIGSRGVTREELGAIGYREIEEKGYSVPLSYQKLLQSTYASSDKYKLEVANALISQVDYPILEQYKNTIRSSYDALLEEVDFSGNSKEAVRKVNNWVSEKTHGKITKLVEDLDETTVLLILNAIYFKGTWKTEFDTRNTIPRPFYNNGDDISKSVPTMKAKSYYRYLHDVQRNLRAVELPYKGEDISMLILLPDEKDGVRRLQNEVGSSDLYDIIDSLRKTKVTLLLPKFKFEQSRSLARHIKSLGAKSMFGNDADLSGITGRTELFVSDVVHKAVIEVNEEGSEAAAITGVIIENKMAILPSDDLFNADHPFIFYIIDKRTSTNLFVGRVSEL